MDKKPFPTLFHFPPLERFAILDLETTGLEESAQPFQLSALKVENWQIVGYFNSYANVPPEQMEKIPYSLARKLHLEEIRERIQSSPPLEEVLEEFLSFLSDLPLIAHNAWFDIGFLRKFHPDLPNPFLDSIELFLLAFPLTTSYSLEELAKYKRVEKEVSLLQKQLGFEGLPPHNALYDCLALFCLLKRAVKKLQNSSSASLLHFSTPSLAQSFGITQPPQELSSLFPLPAEEEADLKEIEGEVKDYAFDPKEVMEFYDKMVGEGKWEKRESQRMMVEKVGEIFHKGKIGMIEAPTGTGKTLAYLLPSAFFVRQGKKVIISTYTKHLQNQAISDMEKKLLPYLPFSPRYVLLKGRGNYLCLRRLLRKIEDGFFRFPEQTSDEERFLLIYLGRFVEDIGDKIEDLDAFPYLLNRISPLFPALKEDIKSERELCLGGKCPFYSRCFFWRAQKAANDADIIITNHWLLLMKRWESPERYSVVIDEAHSLEDAASKALGKEVGKREIADILTLLLNKEGDRGLLLRLRRVLGDLQETREALAIVRELWGLLDEMGKALCSFLLSEDIPLDPLYGASLWMKRSPGRSNKRWAVVDALKQRFRAARTQLGENTERLILRLASGDFAYLGEELNTLWRHLSSRINDLLGLLRWDYEKANVARWIEIEVDEGAPEGMDLTNPPGEFIIWAVKEAPIRVGEYLKEKVYNSFGSLIFTSATLTIAGKGFGFFLDRLGLEDIADEDLLSLPPVFNYRENVFLALPDYLCFDASQQNIEGFQAAVLEELFQLIRYVEGRSLVLFAARDRLEWVGEKLEPLLGEQCLPLYWQKRGTSTRYVLREFKEIEEATLMGLRSFWEGVDVPGTSLCYLVLEKLPFPSIGEPLVQARREEIRRRGSDEYIDYLLPMTIILFKQGFGRLIRSHSDKGAVIFLDKRLRYDIATREVALSSLPGFKRIEEVESSRKELYRAIGEHMRGLFPDFPWNKKLGEVEDARLSQPGEEKGEEDFREEGSFLVRTLAFAPLLTLFLNSDKRVAIISPYDPSLSLTSRYQGILYLPSQPSLNMDSILKEWEEGKFPLLAVHPYWLEDEDIKRRLEFADILIFPNALSFKYSSTFFSPLLIKNCPKVKRKIFLIPPLEEELIAGLGQYEKVISLGDDGYQITFGRIENPIPFLAKAREERGDVLLYTPSDSKNLEEELNKQGFLARWGEEAALLFQKDLLHFLILPPGNKVDKPGTKFVIHYPPLGDNLSYLVEAYQASLAEDGYALSCFRRGFSLEKIAAFMFPEEEIEGLRERLKHQGELIGDWGTVSPKLLRASFLLWSNGIADWRLVEKEIEVVLLADVEDTRLRALLQKAGVSEKRACRLNLYRWAKEEGIPIDELSTSLHRSLHRGELFYKVRKWGILLRSRAIRGSHLHPPISREDVLGEWRKLEEWLSSLPLITPP